MINAKVCAVEEGQRIISDLQSGRRLLDAVLNVSFDDCIDPSWPIIPEYTLLRKLGQGGGGEVFYALRDGYEVPCALKIIHHHGMNEVHARRAWRELDLLQQLNLGFVPRVLDYGLHEGKLYHATDYVEGSALDEHCDRNNLSFRQRVLLLESLARNVQQLHEQGVVHRDLKPSNVIVDMQGRCHVIDLGIADLIENDSGKTITETGAILGSPAYMAPEQARGDRQQISSRSDVYALGAIAYRLLVGEPPHAATGQQHNLMRRVALKPARAPRRINPQLSRSLAAVLAHAVAFEPSDRIATALELAEELRRWLDGKPVHSLRINPLHYLWLATKRRPAFTAAALVAVVAVIASVFFGALALSNAHSANQIVELKDQQDAKILKGIVGALQATKSEEYEKALGYLNVLKSFDDEALLNESFLAQTYAARRQFLESLLEVIYGSDCFDQAIGSFNRLVEELEVADSTAEVH